MHDDRSETAPVGIIGGMGPMAGAEFLRLFLGECAVLIGARGDAVNDQRFPPHYVFQHPVPDRTAALRGGASDYGQVLAALSRQVGDLGRLGARAVALACNTAHAWHGELQARHADIELLHMGDEAARHLHAAGERRVALLSTAGTVQSGIYARSCARHGLRCIEPEPAELALLMDGIYGGVKAGDVEHGRACFVQAVARIHERTGAEGFLMACTEIPLALHARDVPATCRLYDPARLAARALAQRALHVPFAPRS